MACTACGLLSARIGSPRPSRRASTSSLNVSAPKRRSLVAKASLGEPTHGQGSSSDGVVTTTSTRRGAWFAVAAAGGTRPTNKARFAKGRSARGRGKDGEAYESELLIEENIFDTDVFLELTNDDEANIMSSLLAKRLGAKKVMALINNSAYVDLVQGGEIDIAISPQQATIGKLLALVRRGDVVNVHSLRRGAAEAMEAIAHGDEASSKVVGRAIEDIDLPEGTTIGAIVRGDKVLIAHDKTVVNSDDHVILFLVDRKRIPEVEQLFQVGFSFF